MDGTILATKLYIPVARRELVARPRLLEKLTDGLQNKLTLVSAPAGFGKTTLVSAWVNKLHSEIESPRQIAWLSLDEGDNDPPRFLNYLFSAINQSLGPEISIGSKTLDRIRSPHPPSIENALFQVINELAAIPEKIVLVLDDYHLIETQSIHDGIDYLLEYMPPQLHLIIVTREDPIFQISRLRAGGQINELRATDLRFDTSEATIFLNQIMGLGLSPDDVALLETRTEGWIAGLQLAAISVQGPKDAGDFIESFTGSHRLVLDYLIEEVLENQTPEIQEFLLITSCLERLCGSLCDELTGKQDGQVHLEMLDNANLFIVPLDNERCWYRYHHLFRDFLRNRLQQQLPDEIASLQKKACDWHQQNGFIDEAIRHALAAEDFGRAVGLIESIADSVWINGEHRKLAEWLNAIPKDKLRAKPNLGILHASSLYILGHHKQAGVSLRSVEQEVGKLESSDIATKEQPKFSNENRRMRGRLAATRAVIGFYQGDEPDQIIKNANQALKYLPEEDMSWRSSAASALADAQIYIGHMPEAYRTRVEAIEISKAAGDPYPLMLAHLKLAIVLHYQGQIHQVLDICEEQMQICASSGISNPVAIGILLAIWGEALAEINQLGDALRKATQGLELAERGGDIASIGWSYICLVRVLCSRGDLTGAEEIIQMMKATAQEHTVPPGFESMLAAWQVRIWLAQDDPGRAARWAEQLKSNPSAEITYQNELEYMALARLKIVQGQYDEALKLLNSLLITVETFGRTSRKIEILILIALAYEGVEETDKSLSALEQALSLAEPRGFLRIFVDEGHAMELLLQKARQREIAPEYIHRILAAIKDGKQRLTAKQSGKTSQPGLVESLSDREIEVLQLIAAGLTNREIAERLYLSINTVKVHARNIYGKLGVNNRTQAVTMSIDLGFVPASEKL